MFEISAVQFFENIFSFVQEHQFILAVLTPLLSGEISIYFFGVFFGTDTVQPLTIVISFFSIIVYESLVLLLVRYFRRHAVAPMRFLHQLRNTRLIQRLDSEFSIYEKRYQYFPLFLLFALKIMPFTKITIFFFALRNPMRLGEFIIKDCIVTAVWALFIFSPGFLVGRELLTDEVGRNIIGISGFLIISLIIILLFGRHVEPTIQRLLHAITRWFNRNR